MPTLTTKSQVTIPKAIRARLGVGPGQSVDFIEIDGHIEVRAVSTKTAYELGKHLFGRQRSGRNDLRRNRKTLLRSGFDAKHRAR